MFRKQKAPFTPNPQAAKALQQIEFFTKVLDNQFRLPGTNFKFGLDPILGFFPFVGDAVSMALQAALVTSMARFGASRKVVILMVLNIIVDFAIGSIPLLGNIFDFYFKASQRNLNLLKRHYHQGQYQGSGNGILLLVFLVIVAIAALVGYLMYQLLKWFLQLF